MKEITKEIIEALNKLGMEKIKAVDSMEEAAQQLKEYGVEASPAEVQAALEEIVQMAEDKQELGEESLDTVAGGNPAAALIPMLAPIVVDGVKTLVKKFKGTPDTLVKPPVQSKPSTSAPTTSGPQFNQSIKDNQKVLNNVNVHGDNEMGNVKL